MLTLLHVNPSGTRVFMGTLTSEAVVHDALRTVAQHHHIQSATVDMLGGLRAVEFRAFDFDRQQRQAPLTLTRPLEVVAGHGTLALLEGEPQLHLHLVVAYQDTTAPNGVAVVAGHVTYAVAFALEFTLTAYDGAPVTRALDKETGLMLWHLPAFNRSTHV